MRAELRKYSIDKAKDSQILVEYSAQMSKKLKVIVEKNKKLEGEIQSIKKEYDSLRVKFANNEKINQKERVNMKQVQRDLFEAQQDLIKEKANLELIKRKNNEKLLSMKRKHEGELKKTDSVKTRLESEIEANNKKV